MPFMLFFCANSLRQACTYIALIVMVFSGLDALWALVNVIDYPHWIYYVILIQALACIPFAVLLYFGAKRERVEYINTWLVFTLIVPLPSFALLLVVMISWLRIYSILITILDIAIRAYMWMQVREYRTELLTKPPEQFNNPIAPEHHPGPSPLDPPPPYTFKPTTTGGPAMV